MARDKGNRKFKGVFSDVLMPVAKEYVYPRSRNAMFLVGGVGALLIAGLFAFNIAGQEGQLVSNGPLSANHAAFGEQCQNCHEPFGDVSNEKCSVCHEKYGDDIGVFSFTSHYLYRSGDFTRVVPSASEQACFGCHTEHVGRDNPITMVADERCLACHEFGSFNEDHPEFAFARDSLADESNLKFPHGLHLVQIRTRQNLADLEQACLYCHNPEPSGLNFEPIEFEKHCDTCHLTTAVATDWLPVGSPASTESPGVLTLQQIQQQQGPGTLWSYYTNPNEFQSRGDRLRKTPLYHEDPWVLENLKRIRQTIYPSENGLADLLNASADVPARDVRSLYQEALSTLELYAEELRNQPDRSVQRELEEVESLLSEVRRRLRDPYAPLDETQFMVSAADRDPNLTGEQIRTLERFADRLTQPCQKCHYLESATILRTQADQDILIRAEFDHRAHIIQQRCVDCHSSIPFGQAEATGRLDPTLDHAGIQNLPSITKCQSCHDEDKAPSTCVTCHLFHPDKSQHANLLLYLE